MITDGDRAAFEWLARTIPGWRPLIEKLVRDLNELETVHISQIKEKFGGLRVYANGPEGLIDAINEAEDESLRICCVCGQPQTRQGDTTWVMYYCDEHNTADLSRVRHGE